MDKSQFKEAEDWGVNCYCIKVYKAISEQEEIYVFADTISIDSGCLYFSTYSEDGEEEEITFTISNGQWKTCYICNEKTGVPLSVSRWKKEFGKYIPLEPEVIVADEEAVDEDTEETE